MYMKFTVIWTTFRVTALFDGIFTLENLTRCIVNQNSIGEFWKYIILESLSLNKSKFLILSIPLHYQNI